MEAWLLLLVCLLIPLVVLLLAQRGAGKTKSGSRIPPGPLAVPVLGSLVWLRHSSADVEPLLRRLFARYGPVVSLRVGTRLSIYVADRRVAHTALVERGAALADRPAVTRGLLGESGNTISRASYGPAWRLLRRNLVSETLHPSRVRLFAPARTWVHRVLADKLLRESGGPDMEAPPRGVLVVEAFRYAMFCLLVRTGRRPVG